MLAFAVGSALVTGAFGRLAREHMCVWTRSSNHNLYASLTIFLYSTAVVLYSSLPGGQPVWLLKA